MSDLIERPWRCDIIGNPVGTDTRMIGAPPCDCQGCRAADRIAALEAEASEGERWQPIETAPKGRKILAGYFNRLGNWRTVTACYYVANTLPADDDSEEYFAPEGWYECSETNEHILQLEYPPTHWRPLPAPPRDLSQGGQHG